MLWLLLAYLFLFSFDASAFQDDVIGHLPVKHYKSNTELHSTKGFHAFYQDRMGYLWIGYSDGLLRYDGNEFLRFESDGKLTFRSIEKIVEDWEGNLWIQAKQMDARILLRLESPHRDQNGKLKPIAKEMGLLSDTIGGLAADLESAIWVGTKTGLHVFRKNKTTVLRRETGLLDNFVTAIYASPAGHVWLSSARGLTKFDQSEVKQFLYPKTVDFDVHGIVEDDQRRVWLWGGKTTSGQSGILLFSGGSFKTDQSRDLFPFDRTISIHADLRNGLWVATTAGLFRVSGDRSFRINEENGLLERSCFSVFQDREGTLWVGHVAGISKVINTGITSFRKENGLPSEMISRMFRDHTGDLWFATPTGLSRMTHAGTNTLTASDGLTDDDIIDIAEDNTGKIWISTPKGLSRIGRTKAGIFVEAKVRTGSTNEENICYAISKDSKGALWVGKHQGVSRIRLIDGKYEIENFNSPGLKVVLGNSEDAEGNQWFATLSNGAFRFQNGRFTRLGATEGLPTDQLICVWRDPDGPLWFGSANLGVFALRNGKVVQQVTVGDGLPQQWILGVVRDKYGYLWVGTEVGLCRVDLSTKAIRIFTTRHGLVHNQIAVDISGDSLIAATPMGGMIINVNSMRPNLVAPLIRITEALADTLRLDMAKPISLPYNNRSVIFNYIGLSFLDEEDVRYEHKLTGFDDNWSSASNQIQREYTHLDLGEYTFSVRAINRDNVGSISPATLSFTVEPPIWARWWFRASYVLISIGIGAGGYRYISHRKLRRQQLLIERQRMIAEERLRISQDVHDSVGASLTRIAVLGEIVNAEEDPTTPDAKARMDTISFTARTALDEINDIIWSLNPRHDSYEGLISKMRSFAAEMFEPKSFNYRFTAPPTDTEIHLSPEARRSIFLLFKEAIHNAVKYSEASKIDIMVEMTSEMLTFTVIDNGIGFDATSKRREGDGLRNMETRAKKIGGTVSVKSERNIGTQVRCAIPLGDSIAS